MQKIQILRYAVQKKRYSKIPGSFWLYHRDKPSKIILNSKSLKFKMKIKRQILAAGNKADVKIEVPLKHLRALKTLCAFN